MEVSCRLARNIFSSWANYVVQIVLMLLLTPVVLDALGGGRYGVWALLSTITGYCGLLDAGARASLTRNIARYFALRDYEHMNRVASAGLAALLGCAVLLILIALLAATFATSLFRVPEEHSHEFRWCVMIIGWAVATQFCLFVRSAALGARQRHDLATACHVSTQIVYACGVPLILIFGGELIALTLWLSLCNVLSYGLQWVISWRVIPELTLSLRQVDSGAFREFAQFGFGQFLVNFFQQVIGYSDAIVISVTLGTGAVAPFFLANRVARCFVRWFLPICAIFFPVLTHLDALGRKERIQQIYLRAARLMWLLSVGLGFVALMWSKEFFAVWVGDRQAGFEGHVSELFCILLVAAVVTGPQMMSQSVFLALGRQRGLASLLAAEAAANVTLSLLLIRDYSLVGIAWGTCIPAVIFQGVLHPIVICRLLDIRFAQYSREVMRRPLMVAIVLAIASLFRPVAIEATWQTLILAGACSAMAVFIAVVILGLDSTDRQRFLFSPVRKLFKWQPSIDVQRG